MSPLFLMFSAIAFMGLSGVPGLVLRGRAAGAGQKFGAAMMVLGSALGLGGLAVAAGSQTVPSLRMAWVLPWGRFAVAADALSLLFLAPVFLVPALGAIYGMGYWKPSEHPRNHMRLGLANGVLAGSMALVVIARDGVLFLIAWEAMALSAYFAATTDEERPEVCRAGWVYLVATHAGTLCLVALFALWRRATGSFALEAAAGLSSGMADAIFVLALLGFGFKAGLMPLHVWLPGAHANAPSHVSAVMSGVMLKMGVYGIVRMTGLLSTPATWWGGVLLAVGAISGVAGILFAIGQSDLKRLLAYSSIENIGIIMMGVGLAVLGRAMGRADWVLLGLGGALLHVWNHSLFKSLLFFGAGAVLHATHTREMDQMGGLGKRMPRVMALFGVGAIAICALPPLNGFASEWLMYAGFFRTLGVGGEAGFAVAAVGAVALALIGALAVACFVKVLGTVFLGSARGGAGSDAHDPPLSMMAPMMVLAAGCVGIGLFPGAILPLLERAASAWMGLPDPLGSVSSLAPTGWISVMGLALIALALGIGAVLALRSRRAGIGAGVTWDCGYARPTQRMQYTGSSLGREIVQLSAFLLWPKNRWPVIRSLFPGEAELKSDVPDTILDRLVLPLFGFAGRHALRLRVLQQGQTQLYVLYVLFIMIALLIWAAVGA